MQKTEVCIYPRFSFATRSQFTLANSFAWKEITLSGLDKVHRLYDIMLQCKERKRAKIPKNPPFSVDENDVTGALMGTFALTVLAGV